MRLTTVALLLLCVASLARGQNMNTCHQVQGPGTPPPPPVNMCTQYAVNGNSNAVGQPTFTQADNTPNAKVMNVWHALASPPANTVGATSGFDSGEVLHHYFVSNTGAISEYSDPAFGGTNAFSQHTEMGTGAVKIAYGSFGSTAPALFATFTSTSCPATHGRSRYMVYSWNGSAWASTGFGCVYDFDMSPSGHMAILVYDNGNGAGIQYSNGNGSWSGSWLSSGWWYATIVNPHLAYATDSVNSSVYSLDLDALTDTKLTGVTTSGPIASDPFGRVWTLGTDGSAYRYSQTAQWDHFVGTGFTFIDSCGVLCTFAGNTSGISRFPDNSLTASVVMSGNTICKSLSGVQQQCPTSIHTPTLKIKFAHLSAGGQTVTGQGVAPETQINVTAQDTTYDPFTCIESGFDNSACLSFTTTNFSSVACTIAGAIFGAPVVPPDNPPPYKATRGAQTRVDNGQTQNVTSPPPFVCGLKNYARYYAPFDKYCDQGLNPTPPPDYLIDLFSSCDTAKDSHGLYIVDPNLWGIDAIGTCYYPVPNASPLFCYYDLLGQGDIGAGPISKVELYKTDVPQGTKGKCTITGVTQ